MENFEDAEFSQAFLFGLGKCLDGTDPGCYLGPQDAQIPVAQQSSEQNGAEYQRQDVEREFGNRIEIAEDHVPDGHGGGGRD
ncbi:Uncharacterised protein [Mycobacteroides abscessus subsp. massiliense]|nr:Uncharacterised protein [Mycobacteroides abscessus subsp. massiliense]